MSQTPSDAPRVTTSPLLVAAAWAVVGLPAAWGVFQTSVNSTALFRRSVPAPAMTAPVLPPTTAR